MNANTTQQPRGNPSLQLAPAVLSREALMLALWRQRAYADRTGVPFVFVRVRLREDAHSAVRAVLARVASERCRSSDVAGWFGDGGRDVGVLLPNATPQGALRVVRELEAGLRRVTEGQVELACELFVYPGTAYSTVMDWAVGNLNTERA